MIYRMIANDLIRFCSIFFIFVMGFSQAYYIIFQVRHIFTVPKPKSFRYIATKTMTSNLYKITTHNFFFVVVFWGRAPDALSS